MENYINYSYSNSYQFEGGIYKFQNSFWHFLELSSTPVVLPLVYTVQLHKNLILDLHN
jgi:hypothetical protein